MEYTNPDLFCDMSLYHTIGSVGNTPVLLSEPTLELADVHARAIATSLGLSDHKSSLASYWNVRHRVQQWSYVVQHIGRDQAKPLRFLDVGSGMGLFVLCGQLLDFNIWGIESSQDRYERSLTIARLLFADNHRPCTIAQATSNILPFATNSFDVVVSFQTLEHVQQLRATLQEIQRILKPNGLFFAQVPNYDSWYECHYGMLTPLPLGKMITYHYLGLIGRPPKFLTHLQWISPRLLRPMLADTGFHHITVQPSQSGGTPLLAKVQPSQLPYTFKRGTRMLDLATYVAQAAYATKLSVDMFPQIEVWARAAK